MIRTVPPGSLIRSTLLLACAILAACGARNVELRITPFELKQESGRSLRFYVARSSEQELSRRLLVFIQGSGQESVQSRFGMGAEATLLGYDLLYMEKFAYDDPETFHAHDSRQQRMGDIRAVLGYVKEKLYEGRIESISFVADSEGGVIAPEIVLGEPLASHLLILGAGGYSQAKELEILMERGLSSGVGSDLQMAGIESMRALREKFGEIRIDPSSKRFWFGHTHKYWESYLDYAPEPYIAKLRIPTMFIMGEEDRSVPVESARYLRGLLKDRKNFSFHFVPGVDHSFVEADGESIMQDLVHEVILPWYERSMQTASAP